MSAIASTRQGRVEGEERDGISIFRGIPFAKPPVGALRWRAPESPEPWSGVRVTREFGPSAPQNPVPMALFSGLRIVEPQSEDCLYLNVWTPRVDGARRPVLVWIHGGAFAIGSGAQPMYDGSRLAQRGDVVVVSINYRLGPLGFMRLTDLTNGLIPATGNEGILDQIAALVWVRENIAAFGGDPENVTIFGESAGGMSVGTLLGLPRARGLFHKAIPQSGAASTAVSPQRATLIAELHLKVLGAAKDPDGLHALTTAQLLAATAALSGPPGVEGEYKEVRGIPFQIVLDGEIQQRRPIESIARGSAAGVPVMVGSTLDEMRLFLPGDPTSRSMSDDQLLARNQRLGSRARGVIEAYRKARDERSESVAQGDLWYAIETDRMFRMPAVRLAEAQASHEARVFNYLFTWPSPMLGGLLGACHALELPFVFGTHTDPGMADFTGTGPQAEALSEQMMDAWIAFAKTGDPSTRAAGSWPRYEATSRQTRLFGAKTTTESAPYDGERRAWDEVPDALIGATV